MRWEEPIQPLLNPSEFNQFVNAMKCVDVALGNQFARPFSKAEIEYRRYSKKSIVASRDLPVGSVVTRDDLSLLRSNEMGLPPNSINSVIGRTVARFIRNLVTLPNMM